MRPYRCWAQIAGYFDGDGSIAISDLSNQPFKLSLSLVFTEMSFEQVSMVREFLVSRGIRLSKVLRCSSGNAWMIAVSRRGMVLRVLKGMLPYLYKKANEAKSVIDYYEGKITGNELIESFKREVEAGRRERRAHHVAIDVPFRYPEGALVMKEIRRSRLRDAFGRFRAKVTPEDYQEIRREHFEKSSGIQQLMSKYPQYSKETIRRILGRGRGYVGVKGIGRVDTTDTTLREPSRAQN